MNDIINKLISGIENLSKDNSSKEFSKLIVNTAKELNNKPIEIIVAVLDNLYNRYPVLVYYLLLSTEDRIMRAALVLEEIKGFGVINNYYLDISVDINYRYYSQNKIVNQLPEKVLKENFKAIYELLTEYYNKRDAKKNKKILIKDLNDFVSNIGNVSDDIFKEYLDDFGFYPKRSMIVERLFKNPFVELESLNRFYNEAIIKNKTLQKYDFTDIIVDSSREYLTTIKGLYRKIPKKLFDFFSLLNKEDYEEAKELFGGIVKINKDDPEGLSWFFTELLQSVEKNKELYNYLKKLPFVKKYINMGFSYEVVINKLLNGEYENISETVLFSLGRQKKFIDNFDLFLDKYAKSNDYNYKRVLFYPLIHALACKEREKYSLDYEIEFNATNFSDINGGSYTEGEKKLYINPGLLDKYDDIDLAFVKSVDSVFHETRHAKQYQIIEKDNSLNFDNLIMALDACMTYYLVGVNYYKENYEHLSFERDARNMAYVDTMTLLDKYKELQNKEKNNYQSDYHLSNYIRKMPIDGSDYYHGIIDLFIINVENAFEPEYEVMSLLDNDFFNRIKKYPVIQLFFDIDYENKTIRARSIKELEEIANSYEDYSLKKKALNSIREYAYAIKVSSHLVSKNNKYPKGDGYREDVLKEIDENVGKRVR